MVYNVMLLRSSGRAGQSEEQFTSFQKLLNLSAKCLNTGVP